VNVPRDAKTAEALLGKAQLALHSAKDHGGGRVGLSPGDEMVLKSSYYGVAQLARLKTLAERTGKKESVLLREALDDLLRKYASSRESQPCMRSSSRSFRASDWSMFQAMLAFDSTSGRKSHIVMP
jgi:Ribbon-helix-helix domain